MICYAPAPMDEIYRKSPDFVERDVAGECILVPIRKRAQDARSIYVLNETGAALWKRIDGRRTLDDILRDFQEEYDVAPERLAQDVVTLLEDLRSIEAITISSS
ncbi:MAG: PqqD family protein [Nitrospiraceae bacterium]|nr:PqqD family protein [Nitrospiraceae bacterium]